MMLLCGFRRCRQPFEPVPGQEETQKFCCTAHQNCEAVQRYRDRLKGKNGGGPGGGKQPLLFSRADLHRRKPAKAAPKPKQDALFPADISSWFASLTAEQQQEVTRVALMRAREEGLVSDKAHSEGEQILCKILPALLRKPSQSVTFAREVGFAA